MKGVFAVVVVVCSMAVAGSAIPATQISPDALVASAMAAMKAQTSYNYVAASTSAPKIGAWTVTIVGEANRTEGMQRIHYTKGGKTGEATVLVVTNTAYVFGDRFTLQNYMGFPLAAADAYQGQWLSLAHTAPDFAAVAADVRLDSSAVNELKMPTGARVVGDSTVLGQNVIAVAAAIHHAGLTAEETLYVRATNPKLPVEQLVTLHGKVIDQVTFSAWGKTVHETAPVGAIPIR